MVCWKTENLVGAITYLLEPLGLSCWSSRASLVLLLDKLARDQLHVTKALPLAFLNDSTEPLTTDFTCLNYLSKESCARGAQLPHTNNPWRCVTPTQWTKQSSPFLRWADLSKRHLTVNNDVMLASCLFENITCSSLTLTVHLSLNVSFFNLSNRFNGSNVPSKLKLVLFNGLNVPRCVWFYF